MKHTYDIHTHIFPQKIAAHGVENIGKFYDLKMRCDGTGESLAALLPEGMRCVISSATLKEEVMQKGNDFLLDFASRCPAFIPFSSFYPFCSVLDAAHELERVKKLGTKGIKMHPDFQHYELDDPHAVEIYRVCAELELPVLFHVGDKRYDLSSPLRMRRVADKLPGLTIIAAHMCGYSVWDEAEKYLIGTDVYTETSDSLDNMEPERLVDMIRRHGVEKVMFGSDYPIISPADEYERTKKIPLTDAEKEMIFTTNAEKLFNLQYTE